MPARAGKVIAYLREDEPLLSVKHGRGHRKGSMKQSESAREMWYEYLGSVGESRAATDEVFTARHFCDNEKDADELTADLARAEGGGERSLEQWRRAHWNFFSRGPRLKSRDGCDGTAAPGPSRAGSPAA